MRKYGLLYGIVLVVLIPQMLFGLLSRFDDEAEKIQFEPSKEVGTETILQVSNGDEILELELDTYITGVVLGEMPADFEREALKAQAIAARTYTLRSALRGNKHPDADVCTDAACCQAFVSSADYQGGEDALRKVQSAVTDTSGQVIVYNGELIEATYFSSSGGKTEDAVAVWGTDVPYLRSVDSPEGEDSVNYETTVTMSVAEFLSSLGLAGDELADVTAVYTSGGGVQSIQILGKSFSGVQLRNLLRLPSTAFRIRIHDGTVSITTKGNGHRVGMSQYGAEAMAVEGKGSVEILAHYYTDTEVVTYSKEQIKAIFDKK